MILWNYISFSQDLKPKIQTIKGETHFCFSIVQAKTLAEELQLRTHGDTLIKYYVRSIHDLKEVVKIQDSNAFFLEQKNNNLNQIIRNQKINIEAIKSEYDLEKRKNRKTVFTNKALAMGLIIVSGILITR